MLSKILDKRYRSTCWTKHSFKKYKLIYYNQVDFIPCFLSLPASIFKQLHLSDCKSCLHLWLRKFTSDRYNMQSILYLMGSGGGPPQKNFANLDEWKMISFCLYDRYHNFPKVSYRALRPQPVAKFTLTS